MSADVIGRLRELADVLPESVKGYEQLELAGDRLLRRQESLSDLWARDLGLLRAQTKAMRDLRRELWGVERIQRRMGGRRGPAGGRARRGPAAVVRAPRVGGFERSGAAGARAYGRAFSRRLGHSGIFLRSGSVAGRALAASAAASAAARLPGSFRARRRAWTAVGNSTGTTIGLAGGSRAASSMASMMAVSLFGELQRVDALIKAAATITGNTFGTQAGAAATIAFARAFKPPGGGGGGGILGDVFGGAKDLVSGGAGLVADGAGKALDGATWLVEKGNGLPPAVWEGVKAVGNLGTVTTELMKGVYGSLDEAAEALRYGRYATKFLKGVPIAGNVIGAWDLGWQLGKLASGNGDWRETFEAGLGMVPGVSGAMAAKDLYELATQPPEERARGGVVSSGEITLVGERGPEIVQLPAGSNVITAHRTREALERASSAPAVPRTRRDLYIHQVLDGREIARATIRNIDDDGQWGRG